MSLGSLSSHFAICSLIDCGSSLFSKGSCPESISHTNIPYDQMSASKEAPRFIRTSGAVYPTVPQLVCVR